MELWFRDLIENWDWSVVIPEMIGKATGVGIGVMLSWFLLIRRRLQSMGRLQRGDSDDLLFQAHYLHRVAGDAGDEEVVQLLFRNVAEKRTIEQVYDNPAAAAIVRSLGDETTLDQPILPTQGTIGFEVLNDAAGWVSGTLATAPSERAVWMFCLTAEDRKVVRKRCVRGFLIREHDLRKFHDWTWCQRNVRVERPWHWFRIVALHRIARIWADQCRIYSGPGNPAGMPLVDNQAGHRRIVPLSLGLITIEKPVCEPFAVDWDLPLESLASGALTLEAGAWPEGLSQ